MNLEWRRTLSWAALGALALLAFGAVPHLHGEADEEAGHCLVCLAKDTPLVGVGLQATPDPGVRAVLVPVSVPRLPEVTPTGGGGSRAPPA